MFVILCRSVLDAYYSCICKEYNENCGKEYNIRISYLKHERYSTARKGH